MSMHMCMYMSRVRVRVLIGHIRLVARSAGIAAINVFMNIQFLKTIDSVRDLLVTLGPAVEALLAPSKC